MPKAIILFAHGARDPEWAAPFKKIQNLLTARKPNWQVRLAFLEIMQPSLDSVVAELTQKGLHSVHIIPLFMAQGGHLKHDLVNLIKDLRLQFPQLSVQVSPPIGESDAILNAIVDWIDHEST